MVKDKKGVTTIIISHIMRGEKEADILKETIIQWVLFFFIYCFIGWIWETTYVSIRTRKFTNRGFMNGPFLPIYGFGAIAIVIVTIPVKFSYVLTFWIGLIAATVLEYFTGVIMEAVFKVRYWDYSNQRFHYKGHICLSSSIAWGVGTLFITNVVHVRIAQFVGGTPRIVQEAAAIFLSMGVSYDIALSVRDALDVKEILMNIKQNNEEIQKLQKKLDILIALLDDETKNIKLKLEEIVENRQDEQAGYIGKTLENIKKRFEVVERVAGQLEWKVKGVQREEIKQEFEGLKEKLIISITNSDIRKTRIEKHAHRLLRRNPNAVSKEYFKELNEFKEAHMKK